MDTPTTLLEAVRYFSDLDRCEEYMRAMRWRGGKPRCPECESDNIGEIKTRRLLKCRDCKRQIYTKRGTIFEDSPLGLDKWFVAVWAIAQCWARRESDLPSVGCMGWSSLPPCSRSAPRPRQVSPSS